MVLVTDNLNIHHVACLYEAFCPSEARRIAGKIEWHYTPEHGSWLNREIAPGDFLDIAEIELSVLHRQCLARRIADAEHLREEVEAWQTARNGSRAKIHWQFTAADARIKLRKLYPVL